MERPQSALHRLRKRRGGGARRHPPPYSLTGRHAAGTMSWHGVVMAIVRVDCCYHNYTCRHDNYTCRHANYTCRHDNYPCRHANYTCRHDNYTCRHDNVFQAVHCRLHDVLVPCEHSDEVIQCFTSTLVESGPDLLLTNIRQQDGTFMVSGAGGVPGWDTDRGRGDW